MDTVRKLASRRLNSQPAGPHPDPDLLAALAENSISRQDRDNVFSHLSACADCRETLYLALPEASGLQQAFSPNRRLPRLAIRWATLAASVIIIGGVVLSNRERFTEHSVRAPEIAASPSPAAPAVNVRATVQEPAQAVAAATLDRRRPPAKHMTAAPQAALKFDQSGEVHFAAAPSSRYAEEKTTQSDRAAAAAQNQLTAARVVSPVAKMKPLWRISADGVPERSLDGAQSWQAVAVRSDAPFRVIDSVGNDVWVGGEAGDLYHSTDSGHSWTKVGPTANGETLASAVTRIKFSDAQNGMVATANGQEWTTSDGGKNWQLK